MSLLVPGVLVFHTAGSLTLRSVGDGSGSSGQPPLQLLCRQPEVQWRSLVQSLAGGSAMTLCLSDEEREQRCSLL